MTGVSWLLLAGGLGALLVPILLAFPRFVRRHALFTLVLTAPLLLEALAVVRLAWSPRYFLLALPVAAVLGIGAASGWGRGRLLPVLLAAAFTVVSLLSLPRYYQLPKQANRDAVAWVTARAGPEDVIVPVDAARWGVMFYASRLAPDLELVSVRSLAALEAVEAAHREGTVWLLTSFEPALRAERPDLHVSIVRGYRAVRRFPATVENGEITIWASDPAAVDR